MKRVLRSLISAAALLLAGTAVAAPPATYIHAGALLDRPGHAPRGASTVKITVTGGVLTDIAGGLGRMMTPEELRAIVETAHGFGRTVAAHSHALDGTRAALDDVTRLEHVGFVMHGGVVLPPPAG